MRRRTTEDGSFRVKAGVIAAVCAVLSIPIFLIGTGMLRDLPNTRMLEYDSQNEPPGVDYPVVTIENGRPTVPYWVVNCNMSREGLIEADGTLERLNADNIIQGAVLCMHADEVQDVPGYALRFLRFMGLGNAEGQRRDNGFVWIIVHNEETGTAEIRYSAGYGLTRISAIDLDVMRDVALANYQQAGQENVVRYLVSELDKLGRASYEPFEPRQPNLGNPENGTSLSRNSRWQGLWFTVLAVMVFLLLVTVSEAALGFTAAFSGSYSAYHNMQWPFWVLVALAESKGTGTGGTGGSGGGGTGGSRGGRTGSGGTGGRVG